MHLPQRHCFILQGQRDWLKQQAERLYQRAGSESRCWLSDAADRPAEALPTHKALQQLGHSNSLVVFDACEHFSADALGALIGTLKAGGCMLVLLPADTPDSLWLQRFLKIAAYYPEVKRLQPGIALPDISLPDASDHLPVNPTPEQGQAIEAVVRVVNGHRRRPLVITADRGRGKTALLGMAAARLLKQGKTRILVTAPMFANITPLLEHAADNLPDAVRHHQDLHWQQSEICFVAPDALLSSKIPADLLIVDEAAAIPAQMLESMLQQYSRIVFASTAHGYEGTGRGFALRFTKTLDRLTPNWRALTIEQPIRWAVDDGLEKFSFDALLMDAEPVAANALPADALEKAAFTVLDKKTLADNESLLREIYGLMVLAHYRTRPSDLQMLLEKDDISVAVMQVQGHVIASAWLVSEPALNPALAQQVFDGHRRLKGQLLPQTLLAHSGVLKAGDCHFQRILRIAVHPALQRQRLGSQLLEHLYQSLAGHCDVIGTSFAMDAQLLDFWLNNHFLPVRVGQQPDEVSGQRAGIFLRALSEAGESIVTAAQNGLQRDWPFLLLQAQNTLDHALVVQLSAAISGSLRSLTPDEKHVVASFAEQQRGYESAAPLLWQWLHTLPRGELTKLAPSQQALLVKKLLQGQSFMTVGETLNIDGRKAVIKQLRQAVNALLKLSSV